MQHTYKMTDNTYVWLLVNAQGFKAEMVDGIMSNERGGHSKAKQKREAQLDMLLWDLDPNRGAGSE